MQIKNYIDAAKLGLLVILIIGFQAQTLFADVAKSPVRAYTDYSSSEAQDILWLARIVYSETKVREEQIIVAWVVRNREESGFMGAETYKDVALSPNQFSGLWPSDAQYKINMSRGYDDKKDAAWQQALSIAQAVYFADESLRPISENVKHFYSPSGVLRDPSWIKGKKPALTMRDDNGTVRFAFYESVQ